jgi:hypothetical protein
VGAEQPLPVKGEECGGGVSRLGGLAEPERVWQQRGPKAGHGVVGGHELDVLAPVTEQVEDPVGVTGPHSLGETADGLAEAVRRLEGGDPHIPAPAEPLDQVAEHGARLHGRKLVGVADQDQPGLRPHRLEEPRHHRQGDHRGLVDHDHVVRQSVVAVVAEPHRRVRAAAEQPMQRHRVEPREPGLVLGGEVGDLGLDRLLQPGGRLAGRGSEGDPEG